MRKRIVILCILLVVVAALAGGGTYGLHKVRQPHGPYPAATKVIRDLARLETRLKTADALAADISVQILGEVRYGDFTSPVWLVSRTPGVAITQRVLLTGGVHGSEPAGTEGLLRFIEKLAASPDLYPGVAFDIIPLANPWGWVHNKRLNHQGYDLNRDFASFNTQEGRILRDFLARNHYDLIIEHHEDSSAKGFYLYQIANGHDALCRKAIDAVRALSYEGENDTWMVIFRTREGILYTPLWALRLAWLGGGLSLGNYCRLTQGENVFLLETPSRLDMEARLAMQDKVREVLLTLTEQPGR